jgi:hypothetical protein
MNIGNGRRGRDRRYIGKRRTEEEYSIRYNIIYNNSVCIII